MKTVVVGLDGVPFNMIDDLAALGIMPNVSGIMKEGKLHPMRSSIPDISSVSWSSIITGKNPGEHGIYGFTDIPLGTYRLSFPTFNSLRSKPFWHYYKYKDSIIINVPCTYPVRECEGIHISGFVSLDFNKSVWPTSLIPELQNINYNIDVDASKAEKSMDLFVADLNNTLSSRIDAIWHLWRKIKWKVFMVVFTGTDRMMHYLWNAYENEDHKYHKDFIQHFKRIDNEIGLLYSSLSDKDQFIMLSDHGFEKLDINVNINAVLRQQKMLVTGLDGRDNFAGIYYDTKAFALDPGRIYINFKHKYPRGALKESDRESICNDLQDIFYNLTYNDKNVIREIVGKEDIYHGKCIEFAPDLVLIPEKGFNLRARINDTDIFTRDHFTGKHNDNAFFLINKKNGVPDDLSVEHFTSFLRGNNA